MDPKNKCAYLGRSAHLAVMSELTARGYKVTVPEINVGRDVLAFLETKPHVISLQVKSTNCHRLKKPGEFSARATAAGVAQADDLARATNNEVSDGSAPQPGLANGGPQA